MTRVGISITKQVSFRNSTQEFSNVYYYDGLLGTPSISQGADLIDELTAKEKTIHSSAVTFIRGRCWTETGNKATSEMVFQKNLAGTGSTTHEPKMDRERCFLFRLRAGVDSRGNPVYFRKFYHTCGSLGGVLLADSILANITGFSASQLNAIVGALPAIGNIGSGSTLGVLCSKTGRTPTAGAVWTAHTFLEHHQLGDMWRAQ